MSRGSRRQRLLARLAAVGGSALVISLSIALTAGVVIAADSTGNVPTSQAGQNEWGSNDFNLVTANNGTYVTTTGQNADEGYRFGFTIPAGSIISGITVTVDAKSSDSAGCSLAVRISGAAGVTNSFTDRKQLALPGTDTPTASGALVGNLTYGGTSDTWGQVWDPTMFGSNFRLEIRNINDDGDNCTAGATTSVDLIAVSVKYTTMNAGTANGDLSGTVCKSGDFNFIIDMSGSIGQQGDIPSNLQQLKDGINGFVNAFQSQAGASGLYSGTKFSGDSATTITSGYVSAGTFQTAVGNLTGPAGLTPTGLGITTGAGNNANDRAGVPNVMFVLTDGSPNKPNTHSDDLGIPDTWLQGANAAIDAANTARTGGYVVEAVYLSTPTDPGDTSLPFSAAGDAQWATKVMDNIGGGNHFNADFTGFINDLFEAIDCPPPPPANIHIAKDANPVGPVPAGSQIGFDVTISNTGAGDAKDVTIDDDLPAGADLNWTLSPSFSGCQITGSAPNQDLECSFATLAAGASKGPIHVISNTTKADCATIDNSATVDASNDDPDSDGASVTVQCADVKVEKTPNNGTVNAGSNAVFTIVVTNAGPIAATNVTLTDPLPAGYTWTPVPSAGSCSINTGVDPDLLTCTFGTVGAGSTRTVTLTAPTTGENCAVIPNVATVSASNEKDAPESDSASIDVLCGNVGIEKKASPAGPVSAGSDIGFDIIVTNSGDGAATAVHVTDNLPGGISWIADAPTGTASATCTIDTSDPAPDVLTCDSTSMPAKTSFTVHIHGTTDSADCGVISNTAVASSGNDHGGSSTATVTVQCPAIHIVKTPDHASPVNAGEQIGFKMTVYNTGAGSATGVRLSDVLPTNDGLNWTVEDTGAGWGSPCVISAAGVLTCGGGAGVTVPGTTSQAASTFTVHITSTTTFDTAGLCPADSGTVTNTGSIVTTNAGPASDTAVECVEAAVIHIVKTPDHLNSVSAGDQIGFLLTVFNTGEGDATGVRITDLLPDNDGLNWNVANTGAGWGSPCVINTGVLTCGGGAGVPVPGNTTQIASTFTVHITSQTTSATAGTCPGSGTVSNTGVVTTTNAGSTNDTATECVAAGDIRILKTPDHLLPVSPGDQIGFTVTVYNIGVGNATGVKVDDLLPTDAGLNWTIQSQGSGWAGAPCVIAAGFLKCGGADGVTVPGLTSLADSTFKVHIVSPTTGATAGTCPDGTGTVSNTGHVTSSNAGSRESTAVECVQSVEIHVVKVADAPSVVAGQQIGFRIIVFNLGLGNATGVKLSDVLPPDAGLNWAIAPAGVGLGWNGPGGCAILAGTLRCGGDNGVTVNGNTSELGSIFSVHIISTTTVATAANSPVQNEACVASGNAGGLCANDDVDVYSLTLEKDNDAPVKHLELPGGGFLDVNTQNEGQLVKYTLTYDVGATTVHDVDLTDVLPAGITFQPIPAPTSTNPQLTFVNAVGQTLTWHADFLNVDGSVSYFAKIDAGTNKLEQPRVNEAAIVSDETPVDTAQSQVYVPAPPQIETHSITGPPTDVLPTQGESGPGSSMMVILAVLGLLVIAVSFVTPAPAAVRRRNNRR